MKWTFIAGVWYDDEGGNGVPHGLPATNPRTHKPWKDHDRYDDGVVPQTDPIGYTKVSSAFGQSIWLTDGSFAYLPNGGGPSVARDHLIQGAHGDSGWHASTDETAYHYLHPGKQGHPELYLLDVRVDEPIPKHTDGLPMVGITQMGKVNNNKHIF